MMHKPIQFKNLSLSFSHKTCFEAFSGQVCYGDRIAIIGRNGAGKSMLLQMLQGAIVPCDGEIKHSRGICVGYLPQVIHDFPELSGGQRLNKHLTEILALNPNLLLLDEPTNHLDSRNRHSLMRMLNHYQGSLIIVSHDVELITKTTDILWHIDGKQVTVFHGDYHDYKQEQGLKVAAIEQELRELSRLKKETHHSLMKEQERNKSTRIRGEKHIEKRKWPTIRSHTKMANSVTNGDKRLSHINGKKHHLLERLSTIYQPEVLQPKFKITAAEHHKALIAIRDASVAYANGPAILTAINFHLKTGERIAFCGENGSGKSTLVKAILGDPPLIKIGDWMLPNRVDIGYLDQHYTHLAMDKTVEDTMIDAMRKATYLEVRTHLNDFLFRKNEEVQACISSLSGGEKARLSLALIAARAPKLLVLDELTNNLDLETRAHVIQVLQAFPGAMIVISHDEDFLRAIQIETTYQVSQGRVESLIKVQSEVEENE